MNPPMTRAARSFRIYTLTTLLTAIPSTQAADKMTALCPATIKNPVGDN